MSNRKEWAKLFAKIAVVVLAFILSGLATVYVSIYGTHAIDCYIWILTIMIIIWITLEVLHWIDSL
jgi:hypothetical protein